MHDSLKWHTHTHTHFTDSTDSTTYFALFQKQQVFQRKHLFVLTMHFTSQPYHTRRFYTCSINFRQLTFYCFVVCCFCSFGCIFFYAHAISICKIRSITFSCLLSVSIGISSYLKFNGIANHFVVRCWHLMNGARNIAVYALWRGFSIYTTIIRIYVNNGNIENENNKQIDRFSRKA